MLPKTKYSIWLCAFLLLQHHSGAQRMFFNTTSDVYELTGTPGNYTTKDWGRFGIPPDAYLESLALHGDTLYVLTSTQDLYQVLLTTGSSVYLANIKYSAQPFAYNAMACDKNGILYGVFSRDLFSYDPHSKTNSFLGAVAEPAAGDLVFYGDTLLCATNTGDIEAIDINQPSASYLWMSTPGYIFYGLLAMPDNCRENRLFGLDDGTPAHMVELDPVTRTVTGVVGQFPYALYDAASTAETGILAGVTFDSLALLSPCNSTATGSVQVFASSALDAGTTYTLDGSITNTTGLFTALGAGSHSIHIQAGPACTVDSTVILSGGLYPINLRTAGPQDCAHKDGSIEVAASSQALPILYSLNAAAPQTNPVFDQLPAGAYTLSIIDAGHCEVDTGTTLSLQHILPFPGSIALTPAYCLINNGSITVLPNAGIDPATLSTALNDAAFQSSLHFSLLPAATDTLHVSSSNGCRYDSVITIVSMFDPEPAIQAEIKDQRCFTDNGSIHLTISGALSPYQCSLTAYPFTAGLQFDNLGPATYTMSIRDKNACEWDTSFVIQPYPKEAVTLAVDSINPVCTTLNSGALTIEVQGDQAPYWLGFRNTTYASGSMIDELNAGSYSLAVIDKNGCVVDTAHAQLVLEIKPECNTIYLPNSFTPNGDGTNDDFRILHGSPYLTALSLRVYNRYGGVIFASSNIRQGWDGTCNGEKMPGGVYVWEVEYTDLEKTTRRARGTVLLLR